MQSPPQRDAAGGDANRRVRENSIAGLAARENLPSAELATGETLPAEPPRCTPLRHRIVDGDTLEQLAEKYLGASNRASDIYRENQRILPAPDLLPIGAELLITRPTDLREAARAPAAAEAAPRLVPLAAQEIAALRARTGAPPSP